MAFVFPMIATAAGGATAAGSIGAGIAGATAAGSTLSTLGTIFSVGSALFQGFSQYQAANAAAKQASINARTAIAEAAAMESRQRRASAMDISAGAAGYGASGVRMEGSPLDIMEQSAYNAELDALTTRWKGQVEATNYRNEAAMARASGRNALIGGFINAGGAAIKGASSYITTYQRPGSPVGVGN